MLADRIRAALDETERVARAAGGSAWIRWTGFGPVIVEQTTEYGVVYVTGAGVVSDEGQPSPGQVDHILRHDPERVLRMVAAHRQILDEHPLAWHKVTWPDEDGGFTGGRAEVCDTCLPAEVTSPAGGPCATVTALAEAYGVEAYGVETASPQRAEFLKHLDEHHCADENHPAYMGGFGHCAEAMRLFNLQPDHERVLIG